VTPPSILTTVCRRGRAAPGQVTLDFRHLIPASWTHCHRCRRT
jgi:hypothetical protein